MSALKHFTVIETGEDNEAPMIGTFDNVTSDKIGKQMFRERLQLACNEHFDADVHLPKRMPDLFAGSAYEDINVLIDGVKYQIRIIETWIY